MADIIFPVTQIDDNKFMVVVDSSLYANEAIVASCYKFTDKYFIHQQSRGSLINIIFEGKDGCRVNDVIIKTFCNELIDQQVRYNTNLQFGKIRDMIVEEAFKPVTK